MSESIAITVVGSGYVGLVAAACFAAAQAVGGSGRLSGVFLVRSDTRPGGSEVHASYDCGFICDGNDVCGADAAGDYRGVAYCSLCERRSEEDNDHRWPVS